jgi:hypothetical protein
LSLCRVVVNNTQEDYFSQYEGQTFTPEKDEDGVWHCEECMVKLTHWDTGKMKLKNVAPNTNENTNTKYPYFAKFDKIEEDK